MDDPKSFYGWVQVTMLGLNLGCFGVLILIIILSQITGKLSEILVEMRRAPVPPAPPPAPGPTPLELQAMIENRAMELVRQRDAARSATPPPVTSSPAKPSAPTPRPAAPRPTPPKPTP